MVDKKILVFLFLGILQVKNVLAPWYSMICGGPEDAIDRQANPPLHEAVKSKDLDKVKLLIKKDKELVHAKNSVGLIALHWAAHNGSVDIAQELLSSGSKVHEEDLEGFTPLFFAAKARHPDIVALLVKKGAPTYVTPVHMVDVQPFINQVLKEMNRQSIL